MILDYFLILIKERFISLVEKVSKSSVDQIGTICQNNNSNMKTCHKIVFLILIYHALIKDSGSLFTYL